MSTQPVKVVCLCATWCGVCRDFATFYSTVKSEMPEIEFDWIDIEDDAARMGDIEVENFPSLLIGIAGKPVFFGPITPHRNTLERLIQNASSMPPLAANFDSKDDLETLLAGG
jgi:thiol-disulfide isomerase/thioredoxin